MIDIGSRYYGIPTATTLTASGRTIVYLRRRFVPPPERFALLYEHTVMDGDRPDLLAHHYLGDPEQFWRLCDANNVLAPEALTSEPGRRIRITLPEGVPGVPDA
jgi:hypothetical protein